MTFKKKLLKNKLRLDENSILVKSWYSKRIKVDTPNFFKEQNKYFNILLNLRKVYREIIEKQKLLQILKYSVIKKNKK